MHAENFFVHNSGYRKAVKTIGKGLPQLDTVSAFAFVVESINSINGGTFMVATKDEKIIWILDLVR